MIGCKPLCFFGEVPPRQERTKKKPYAGGNRAGTACGQTDTEEEPGKLAERTSQSLVCQVVRRKSAESAGTPHIHERHVFDCENKYGEIAPQQEKALDALGFELPKPDKPFGRYNNRKITFDAVCRTMLFEIAKRHGLELDEVPEYGGRAYLEKQDYIMAKQKEQLAQQEKAVQEQTAQLENLKQEHENENLLQVRHTTYQSLTIMSNDKKIQKQENRLDELSQQIDDAEMLLEEISAIAYDKAVAVVSEKAAKDALRESTTQIDLYLDWLRRPERKASKSTLEYTLNQFTTLRKRVVNAVNVCNICWIFFCREVLMKSNNY